jgi:hypothetical protein
MSCSGDTHVCFFHFLVFVNQKIFGSSLRPLFRQNTPGQTLRVERNTEGRSRKYFYRGKAICITYSDCVFVAILIQHAKRMRHLWPALLYNIFQHFLINGTIFGRKIYGVQYVFCFCLQLLSETILMLRTVRSAAAINVNTSSFIGLVSLICVRF